ncbi:MAG: protein translocase subunit SecF [Chloroflexota bacterium]
MFDFIGKKRIWFTVSLVILLIGCYFWATKGLNVGIDFRGGSILDLRFEQPATIAQVREVLSRNGFGDSSVQAIGSDGREFLMRTLHMPEDVRQKVYADFRATLGEFAEIRFEGVSPVVGRELVMMAIWATAIAIVGMLIYVTIRFEYRFAVAGVIALVHDVLVTIGFFAVFRLTVDSTFIAAILTVIGYSINDTIVIYDRIREKLKTRKKGESLDALANQSINETMRRSILTSLTTVAAIASLLFLGGVTIRPFTIALIVGMVSGTYSTVFIASPIWTTWRNWEERRNSERHRNFVAEREASKAVPAKPANKPSKKSKSGKNR